KSTLSVIYNVVSQDGTVTQPYTVNVSIAPNNAAVISEFSLNGAPGTIDQVKQTISVPLPYGTNPGSLQVLFKTEGQASVFDKNGKTLATGDLVTDFNPTLSTTYKVVAEDKTTTQTYTVTATIGSVFVPYYPAGCTLNNDTTGTIGTCTCIQDLNTLDVWMTSSSEVLKWVDARTWAIANNASSRCGFTDGWSLPTNNQLERMAGYIAGNNSGDARSKWLNSNGFMNVKPDSNYWGPEADSGMPPPYDLAAHMISMNTGGVVKTFQAFEMNTWAVHSNKPSFIPYYPKDCTLNNDTDGIVGTCTCIQDPTTLDVWLAKPYENIAWSDAKNWAASNNVPTKTCGLTTWDLPTKDQLDRMFTRYLVNIDNGYARSQWLNSNGFTDATPYADYWGPEYSELPVPSAYMLSLAEGRVIEDVTKRYILNAWAVSKPKP